jgi:hypothetical protein
MWEQVQDMLRRTVQRSLDNMVEFLPGLLAFIVIALLVVVIAVIARWVVLRVLHGMDFDRRAELLGLGAVADWSSMGPPSLVAARAVTWLILLAGLLAGLSALDAELPEQFARAILAYLPDVLAALAILVLGALLARFLARSVLIGAVNLHLPSARLLSVAVKWLVLVLAWTMALEHLGIGRNTLMLAFAILFGGIVLAVALALGLGAKDMVRTMLERQARPPQEGADKLTHV